MNPAWSCTMPQRRPAARFRLSSVGRATRAIVIACVAAACEPPPSGDAGGGAAAPRAPDNAISAGAAPTMAITIDDVPWIGAVRPGESRQDALGRLIEALRTRSVPAMAFLNCDRVGAGAPLLRPWLEAGLELGNHSAAHLDLNTAPLARWLGDVRSCHEFVANLTGADRVWFRYPFLHQGPTPERQHAALALLRELDSPVAHVTIDNSDWILAVAYGNAVTAGDEARATAIGEAFVDHILRATAHYAEVARRKAGRDVRHVLLLHANLLVADHVGALLDRLRDDGFTFISVAAAHRDPIYLLPDEYTGPDGLSWLYRMQPATPGWKAWDDDEAKRLRERWR